MINTFIEVESVAFTLQAEFFDMYNKLKAERFEKAFEGFAEKANICVVELAGDALDVYDRTKAKDSMLEWYKKTHSVGDSNAVHEAEDMQMLLESYVTPFDIVHPISLNTPRP
jgi:hypothetical protein